MSGHPSGDATRQTRRGVTFTATAWFPRRTRSSTDSAVKWENLRLPSRIDEARWREIAPLVPFSDRLRELQKTRHDRQRVDPRETAGTLTRAAEEVEALTRELDEGGAGTRLGADLTPAAASRAASYVGHLRSTVSDFNDFYACYDPLYTWWVGEPYERLDEALGAYAASFGR